MGMFNSIRESFNAGKERARNESYRRKDLKKIDIPIKLVEPSEGKILELYVTDTNAIFVRHCMSHLETYAKALHANYTISGNHITLELPEDIAKEQRLKWRDEK